MTKELQLLFDTEDRVLTEGSFFCINPITKGPNLSKTQAKSWRNDLNVSVFRNFLFEIDSKSLEEQESIVSKLTAKFPIRTVTYSGGKSYHLIISLTDSLPFMPQTEQGVQGYKDLWTHLCHRLETYLSEPNLFDRSTKNPSRLSRIPNGTRENGVKQNLVYSGPLATADFVMHGFKARVRQENAELPLNPDLDELEFQQILAKPDLANLRIKFTRPETWVASVNMYPELFRLTMWAIDSTGVPKKTLINYLQRTVLPAMLEVGYDASKWDKGIHAAYEYKGL